MKLRLKTLNTPLFNEGGLGLTESWKEFDLDSMTPEQVDLIEAYTGQIIQVAPDQLEELGRRLGLSVEAGRFGYEGGKPEGAPDLGSRHTAREKFLRDQSDSEEPKARKPATVAASTPSAVAPDPAKPVNPQPITPVPTHDVNAATTATTKKTTR